MLFRIDYIEKAGTGIGRMREEAERLGYPEPEFSVDSFFNVTIRPIDSPDEQKGTKLALSRHQVDVLANCIKPKPLVELMGVVGRSDRTKFRNQVLNPLVKAGLMEMTNPESPRSPKQRYRITSAGLSALKHL